MYITNNPKVAQIAEKSGVDRIFVDMEYIGKNIRQGGMDTVQSHHTIEDVMKIKKAVSKSEVLVRCNPIHEAGEEYKSSLEEINEVIQAGANYVMLPYFKTVQEVKTFLDIVNKRTKAVLLLETPEAAACVDEILELDGIDEILIGLNDLSLGYGKKFMFELLSDGTVENLAIKFRLKGIPFGFGGIAGIGKGMLPAEKIIREHYRLFSESVILSRSFCNTEIVEDEDEIEKIFVSGIEEIRAVEKECMEHSTFFEKNMYDVAQCVERVKSVCREKK